MFAGNVIELVKCMISSTFFCICSLERAEKESLSILVYNHLFNYLVCLESVRCCSSHFHVLKSYYRRFSMFVIEFFNDQVLCSIGVVLY